VKKIIIVKD